MIIKILLKILPAITPILLYFIWQFVEKKIILKIKERKKIIEGEKIIGEKSSNEDHLENNFDFKKLCNFNNRNFILILYLSMILMIACLIILAFD